jgi:hypothetical protein
LAARSRDAGLDREGAGRAIIVVAATRVVTGTVQSLSTLWFLG